MPTLDPGTLSWRSHRSVEVRVQLATPQFGGGAISRQVDLEQWLRPSSVRGAIRFFWRALHSHRYSSIAELRSAEEKLLGGAGDKESTPGRIGVTVRLDAQPQGALAPWAPEQGDPRNVAYFPAMALGGQPASELLSPGATASIGLQENPILAGTTPLSDEDWSGVKQALCAYVVLGGNGARTRKTAGALVFASGQEAAKLHGPTSLEGLRRWLSELPQGRSSLPVFSLAQRETTFILRSQATSEEVQRQLLDLWRDIRQDRPHPSSWCGANGWGRSKWPEADAVRWIAGQHARWDDGTEHAPLENNRACAPRAHLGLPIIIKFKDDPDALRRRASHPQRGALRRAEPDKVELIPVDEAGRIRDRYASPVLLSVVRVADQGQQYAGVVMITPSLLRYKVGLRSDSSQRLVPCPWPQVCQRIVEKIRSKSAGSQPLFDQI